MTKKQDTVTLELVGLESEGTALVGFEEVHESPGQSDNGLPLVDRALPNVPERLELVAEREIVLRCGQASVTLTRAGKIILRGTYVLSRSSGVNRIAGGSVQIN
jgi:hypothetical protein